MKVHRDINSLPKFRKAVVTVGTFDGVHTGHLQIIKQLKDEAERIGGETVIITFHPHPRMVINPKEGKKSEGTPGIWLLNTLDEKISLLQKQSIDHLVIVPFDQAFSEQKAGDYIRDFLKKLFNPHTIIIGYDHHFGKGRSGNYKLLEEYGSIMDFSVNEIPGHVLNDVAISSTRIREALLASNLITANKYLGYDYFFSGEVVEGDKIGRTLGFPTANIRVNDFNKLIPGNGVYAVHVIVTGSDLVFNGMMNIGIRPTIGGTKRMMEINIFGLDENIYHTQLTVFLKKFLRPEIKFAGLPALKAQLFIDKKAAEQALNEL
ncbi:MAG: bifunctional riboflavin kinase/FAD synthetase [Ginsengibacter sp.]